MGGAGPSGPAPLYADRRWLWPPDLDTPERVSTGPSGSEVPTGAAVQEISSWAAEQTVPADPAE